MIITIDECEGYIEALAIHTSNPITIIKNYTGIQMLFEKEKLFIVERDGRAEITKEK